MSSSAKFAWQEGYLLPLGTFKGRQLVKARTSALLRKTLLSTDLAEGYCANSTRILPKGSTVLPDE